MTTKWNYFNSPQAGRRFIIDRLERIAPLYWIATGIVVGIALLAPQLTSVTVNVRRVLSSLLFFPDEEFPLLKVGWTLNYEIYFYLVFSLFLLSSRRLFFVVGPIFAALSISAGYILGPKFLDSTGYLFRLVTDPLLIEFALGCTIGVAYKRGMWLPYSRLFIVFSCALIISTAALSFPKSQRLIYWGLPSALILFSVLSWARQSQFEANSTLSKTGARLGDSSYSLYLFHPIIMPAIGQLWKLGGLDRHFNVSIYVVFAVLTCLILGHSIHTILEVPLIRAMKAWRRRASHKPDALVT